MISLWLPSILINIVTILILEKRERNEVTYYDLLVFFIFGILLAPLFLCTLIIVGITRLFATLYSLKILDKVVYKFK